jgi:hypothetical protein
VRVNLPEGFSGCTDLRFEVPGAPPTRVEHPLYVVDPSVDTAKPATRGRVKTGHQRWRPRPVEIYFACSSCRKSVWILVRQLRGPHLRTWACINAGQCGHRLLLGKSPCQGFL